MIMRRVVLVLGALVLALGLSQVFAASWWLRIVPAMLAPHGLRIAGVIALLIGLVLVDAALLKEVGLRWFVVLIGALMLVGGVALLFSPNAMSAYWTSFASRPHASQMTITWVAGIFRAIIGLLLIWAATKAAGTREGTHHVGV